MNAVKLGMSIRGAGPRFGIPASTLCDHVTWKCVTVQRGGPTILTPDEEKEIVASCKELVFPVAREFVSGAVRDYLKHCGRGDRFRDDGIPGKDWWNGFFRRHPKLVERKPQHLSRCCAQAANPRVYHTPTHKTKKEQ